MSTQQQPPARGAVRADAARPQARRTIETYDRYADAERAVDFLADNGSPWSVSRSWAATCASWSR